MCQNKQIAVNSYADFGLVSDDDLMILEIKKEVPQQTSSEQEQTAREKIRLLVDRYGAVKKFNSEGAKLKHFPAKVRFN